MMKAVVPLLFATLLFGGMCSAYSYNANKASQSSGTEGENAAAAAKIQADPCPEEKEGQTSEEAGSNHQESGSNHQDDVEKEEAPSPSPSLPSTPEGEDSPKTEASSDYGIGELMKSHSSSPQTEKGSKGTPPSSLPSTAEEKG